ncbi:hypothetical protein FGIG_12589 [Fasciola gigantica]|uniref:Uncharacterized protein n=1 Tax=Fasciola gigantica TaxID=46835 RepID=A0A504YRK5_FASGI|nr:hypothetical protein FGIG_12589 [Fasciola gigantica]
MSVSKPSPKEASPPVGKLPAPETAHPQPSQPAAQTETTEESTPVTQTRATATQRPQSHSLGCNRGSQGARSIGFAVAESNALGARDNHYGITVVCGCAGPESQFQQPRQSCRTSSLGAILPNIGIAETARSPKSEPHPSL